MKDNFLLSNQIMPFLVLLILSLWLQEAHADSVRPLVMVKVTDLPGAPGLSQGRYQPEITPPRYYGPSSFDVSPSGEIYVVDSESPSAPILRLDKMGKLQEKFNRAPSGQTLARQLLSAAGAQLYAFYPEEKKLRVWQAGNTKPIATRSITYPKNWEIRYVSDLWATQTGVCYLLVGTEESMALLRIPQSGVAQQVKLPPAIQGSDIFRDRIAVSASGNLYITAAASDEETWSVSRLDSNNQAVWTKKFAAPTQYHVSNPDLLGFDGKGNIYLRLSYMDRTPDAKGWYNTGPSSIVRVNPAGQLTVLGGNLSINRMLMRFKNYRIGYGGEIYLIYPLKPDVPEGEKIYFALGQLK